MQSSASFWFVSVLTLATGQADFDHIVPDSHGEFEFIYHESNGLVLTLHNSGCYFTAVYDTKHYDPNQVVHVTDENKVAIEDELKEIIVCKEVIAPSLEPQGPPVHGPHHHPGPGVCDHLAPHAGPQIVEHSSLEKVRQQFHDLLADFRCLDKSIYLININLYHYLRDQHIAV